MDEDLIEMMECLNNYVGEEIVYDTWFYGNRVIGKGILKNVKPYSINTYYKLILSPSFGTIILLSIISIL